MNDIVEENQEQDDFYPVLEALFAYESDVSNLESFVYLATSVLGENWREDIYHRLEIYDPDTITIAKQKLEEVINFESAKITWEEAVKIIENPEAQDMAAISQRLDDFKYWLAIFGEDGEELFNSLSETCHNYQFPSEIENFDSDFGFDMPEEEVESEYHNELVVAEDYPSHQQVAKPESLSRINVYEHLPSPDKDYSYLEQGIDDDVLWYLNNYILLMDYHDRTMARIGARCVHLGGITLEQYPHFTYILDILEEICETGDIILEHKELEPLIEARIKGGMIKFKRDLGDFKSELEKNATPDMIKEEEDMSDIIEKLGGLAKEDDNKAGMGIDDLINKLSAETGIGSSAAFEDDDLPPPPPPPEEKKIKRYFGKRPQDKSAPAKQPATNNLVKKTLVKKAMPPQSQAQPIVKKQPVKPNFIKPDTAT